MNRWVKKLSAVALTAGILMSNISYMPMTSSVVNAVESEVEEEVHIWDGTTDVSWYDDEETEFHISTPEQLAGLSSIVNTGKTMEGKTFILDNDIYLNDVSAYDEWETTPPERTWIPIGDSNGFSGTFDGGGNRIIGLYSKTADGLFKNVISGVITNINLEDAYVLFSSSSIQTTTLYGGIIVSMIQDGLISSCSSDGIININAYNRDNKRDIYCYVGGICGSSNSPIIYCENNANVRVYSECGLKSSTINKNGYYSIIYYDATSCGGGICGKSSGIINGCKNNGKVSSIVNGGKKQNCKLQSGGIAGQASNVQNCANNGDIGSSYSSHYSAATPDTGVADCSVGGIASSATKIKNCYNTGEVTCINDAGGIVGKSSSCTVINTYNTGEVSGQKAYAISPSDSISNSYYLTGTASSGSKDSDATIAKSEANMKKESFVDALGEAFYYVESEFPKLAFEVGRTISNFDKKSLAFKEFGKSQNLTLDTTYLGTPEWISSDTSVATVDSDGVVTAVGNGTAMIYALCSDSKAACSVTVGYDYYLSDNELTLKKGRVHDLSVLSASTGEEVTDIGVEWRSSDDSIVSVDSEGKITTNAVGTAAITAKVADLELSCIVSIYEYQVPAVIVPDDENAPKLSETDFTISTIDSKLLSVENYSDSITWVSANTSIAKVSKNGLVKGVSEGNTMIYALLSDGRCLKANAVVTKSEYTMGDVNLDGEFNVTDAVLLQKWLLAVPDVELKCWKNADFYADGKLDVFDLCMMKNALITK